MTTRSTISLATLGAALALFAIGCGHEEIKPPTTTTTTTVAPAPALATASPGKTNSTVYLSDRLRKACGITAIDSAKDSPKFDFDQNAILPEDRDVLAQVAACLTTGALKGKPVKLVGRADPRGTPEYNMALGERRANAVLKYLAALGVAGSQLTDTSRGSLDATGNDDAAWRQDRRVDIDLVVSAP